MQDAVVEPVSAERSNALQNNAQANGLSPLNS
jgi:hypothetical protein